MVSRHNDPRAVPDGEPESADVDGSGSAALGDAFDEDEDYDEDVDEEDDDDFDEDDEEDEEDDGLPRAHRHTRGGAGFGPAIAGVMHGIDADIFRDPAAIQRMQRDSHAVLRTADGTVVAISLPGEGVIDTPDPDKEPAE